MVDRILIRGLTARGILGVYDWERQTPREIVIDLELYTDTHLAGMSDDLADCVNYDALASAVLQLAETARRQTIEALAQDIARLCLEHSGVQGVQVRVEKPGAVRFARSAGVVIERWRDQ